MTTNYKFKAGYTKNGIATAPSPAPTISVVDSSNNLLVNAQATTALSQVAGLYSYTYAGADGLDVIGLFHTSDTTIDQQDLYSYVPFVFPVAGSNAVVITVNDGVNPLDGVDVWAATDSAGNNVIQRGFTDTSGRVTFYLDPGTYYIWKTLARYTFTNPSTLVV